MATGYDNRQPTRASFAFKPTAAQSQSTAGTQAAPVRGGVAGNQASQRGSVRSGVSGIDVGIGTQLPAFLEKVFEPVIQAASLQRMYDGAAAAIDGKTMQEIGEAQPTLSGLFGQTDFERGASFMHAQKGVSDWQAEQLADMERLKRLDPKDVGKVLFEGAQRHMTGDTETDNAIHRMVIEQSAQLLPRVTTARIEWRRDDYRKGMLGVTMGSGANYQTLVDQSRATTLGEGQTKPTEEMLGIARDNLMASFIMPSNMPPEDWELVVEQTARGLIESGHLDAAKQLAEGGANSVLFKALGHDGAKMGSILSLMDKASKEAMTDWLMMPENLERRIRITTGINSRRIVGGAISDELSKFSDDAMAATGSTVPLYSPEDILREIDSQSGTMFAEDRAEARRQIERKEDPSSPENKLAAAEADATNIRLALASPTLLRGVMADVGREKVDLIVGDEWSKNPVATATILTNVFTQTQEHFPSAARAIQADFWSNSAAGIESAGATRMVSIWRQMRAVNPQAAASYFGTTLDTALIQYDREKRAGKPVQAAFNDNVLVAGVMPGTPASPPPPAGADRDGLVRAARSYRGFWSRLLDGNNTPTANSVDQIVKAAGGLAARRREADGNTDWGTALETTAEALYRDGTLDRAGRWWWNSSVGRPSMASLTGLPEDRVGRAFTNVVKDALKNPGFESLSLDNLRVDWSGDPTSDGAYWVVWGDDARGRTRAFHVRASDLRARDQTDGRSPVRAQESRHSVRETIRSTPLFSNPNYLRDAEARFGRSSDRR